MQIRGHLYHRGKDAPLFIFFIIKCFQFMFFIVNDAMNLVQKSRNLENLINVDFYAIIVGKLFLECINLFIVVISMLSHHHVRGYSYTLVDDPRLPPSFQSWKEEESYTYPSVEKSSSSLGRSHYIPSTFQIHNSSHHYESLRSSSSPHHQHESLRSSSPHHESLQPLSPHQHMFLQSSFAHYQYPQVHHHCE
eukprot:Pompholyxophrys_sp_v1_NODE_2_length_20472_cov_5.132586.p13 type:complete len:193 gc:universal NODE_2_length_20472_cov_5.132586:5701-5123(-)